jgi:hypothetical protein
MRANILTRLLLKGFFKQPSHKIALLMQEIKKIDRTFNASQTEENDVGVYTVCECVFR